MVTGLTKIIAVATVLLLEAGPFALARGGAGVGMGIGAGAGVGGVGAGAGAGTAGGGATGMAFSFPFAAPVVAAPVAPPIRSGTTVPVPRNFTLYFDTNVATLSPEARDIVRQAAAVVKQGPMTHAVVTGHTDTVGSARYNQDLSERRADAVQAELIAQGLPAGNIVASGAGESQLAVPTPDGVDEPRNRRVVISVGGPGM